MDSNDNQVRVMTEPQSEMLGLNNSLIKQNFNFSIQTRKEDTFSNSPVGLYGFAFACYISGCSFLHLTNYDTVSICVLWILGGLFQFVMGIIEWYRGYSLSCFLSIHFGLYNMSFLFFDMMPGLGWCSNANGTSKAWFNFVWALHMIGVVIASFPGAKVSFVNNIIVVFNFIFQGLLFATDKDGFGKVAGVLCYMICFIVLYLTLSLISQEVYKCKILPLFSPGEETYWSEKKWK